MPREEYQRALDDLRGSVLAMADEVLDRLHLAVGTLRSGDEEVAEQVLAGHREIDAMYLDLEASASTCWPCSSRSPVTSGSSSPRSKS